MKDQRHTRREYTAPELRRAALPAQPLTLFQAWFRQALAANLEDATAMALATADADGRPAVRIVLLKHFDEDGFCWYTDYRSRKGRQLAENPQASCLFYWSSLHRQVRISGTVERLDEATSTEYFESRPEDSRFSAAASRQSAVIDSRDALEARVAELRSRHPDGRVPRPAEWGGFRLRPRIYEFWQGREHRLHDRFEYTLEDSAWSLARLQP